MLFARPRAKKVVAVFDISSSSVAGAHVLLGNDTNKDARSLFLASTRIDATSAGDPTIDRLIEQMSCNLETVVARLQQADVHHPDSIQVVLASPWYISQTRTIKYDKSTLFVCTSKLVNDLIEKELAHALKEMSDTTNDQMVVVEKQLSAIALNGYPTDKPYGQKVSSVELSITVTMAPTIVMDRLLAPIRRMYADLPLSITTAPFAMYIVARDHMSAHDECIIVDVGEEITDVAFVKNGLFLYQHSFPVGTYALYRNLASADSILEARTIFESYRMDKLGSLGMNKVKNALIVFQNMWQKSFQQVLDNGHYGFCLPEHCYIASDPRFETLLVAIIAGDPFIQHACSRGSVQPVFLSRTLFESTLRDIDERPLDIPLSIATLFAKRLIY